MYESGDGAPKNDVEAVKWFRRAAEQGLANAQGMLGIMYAKAEGVPRNYVLAYMWLDLAAKGRQGAAQFRDAVAERMSPGDIARAQRLAHDWKPTRGGLPLGQ
jgi:uncharacterized protein